MLIFMFALSTISANQQAGRVFQSFRTAFSWGLFVPIDAICLLISGEWEDWKFVVSRDGNREQYSVSKKQGASEYEIVK